MSLVLQQGQSYKVSETIMEDIPSPSSPVEIYSVGDKTANLCDASVLPSSMYGTTVTINPDGTFTMNGTRTSGQTDLFTGSATQKSILLSVIDGSYTIASGANGLRLYNNGTFVIDLSVNGTKSYTGIFTDVKVIFNGGTVLNNLRLGVTIVEGSTIPTEYIPYGYAIPIKHTTLHGLPSAYEELEYIESSGTQYIDTGYTLNSTNFTKLKYAVDCAYISQQGWMANGVGGNSTCVVHIGVNNTGTFAYGNGINDVNTSYAALFNTRYLLTLDIPNTVFSVVNSDGTTVVTTTVSPQTPSTSANLFLSAWNGGNGTAGNVFPEILYGCRIYEDNTLVRNLIPAKRISDGTIGMYDIAWTGNQYGCVDLGTLTWTYDSSSAEKRWYATAPSNLLVPASSVAFGGYHDIYPATSIVYQNAHTTEVTMCAYSSKIYIRTLSSTVAPSGYLYYQRTTDTEFHSPFYTNSGTGTFTGNELTGTDSVIYASAPLRCIGNVKDTLNYATGTITRNVGEKVLDGTETWTLRSSQPSIGTAFYCDSFYRTTGTSNVGLCNSFEFVTAYGMVLNTFGWINGSNVEKFHCTTDKATTVNTWKAWLATQYSAGTPVEVLYPLTTSTTESITCPSVSISTNNLTNTYEVTSDVQGSITTEFTGDITTDHNVYYNSKEYPIKYNNKNY